MDRIQQALKEVSKDNDPNNAPNNLGIDGLYSPYGVAVDWITG